MTERHYTEDEVAAIFKRATDLQHAAPRLVPATQGLTLVQLHAIAREAGIAEHLVSEAARAVDQPPPPPVPSLVGIPIGVTHAVELGRPVAEAEWNDFVGELRTTFAAQGELTHEGAFRSWHNGNLSVMLEPSGDGHRIRFQTRRDGSVALSAVGAFLMGFSIVMYIGITLVAPEKAIKAITVLPVLGMPGIAMLAAGLMPLRGWLRTRREQFQRLGVRLLR